MVRLEERIGLIPESCLPLLRSSLVEENPDLEARNVEVFAKPASHVELTV